MRLRDLIKTGPENLAREDILEQLRNRLRYTIGQQARYADDRAWNHALTYVVRDRLIDNLFTSLKQYQKKNRKRVYYLSLEFLTGRLLQNALINLDMEHESVAALMKLGIDLEELRDKEPDAGLGNGGLGRLAACFLDSMASLGIPGFGYGIRYEYGMFKQKIENGYQVEHPDNWLRYGNPWEIPQPDLLYPIHFYGHVESSRDDQGRVHHNWVNTQEVMAMPYDLLVPGYRNQRVNLLRLWSAKSSRDFELKYFNEGNYIRAVQEKNASENISRVLYPDDTSDEGKKLRLKQEYFFVSAALQDILSMFNQHNGDIRKFPDRIAIQLNDTHPAIAIPELMRLLMDEHKLEWHDAWPLCVNTFSYTNHTLMPEALESWPLHLFQDLLPRHTQIILEINKRFLDEIRQKYPDDHDKVRRLSIIDEEGDRRIRMANLAVIGSHKVNGVSRIHTDLLEKDMFRDFYDYCPDRFLNLTNGINQKRWLRVINPKLAELITDTIGSNWIMNLDELQELKQYATNKRFVNDFLSVKHENKLRLTRLVKKYLDRDVNPVTLFDVQVKRIHEYKRQLLNVLHVITLYSRLLENPSLDMVPRTVMIGGKSAPGYFIAKLVIKLISDVSKTIEKNPAIHDKLRLVFIPNYDVTTAGDIIPAAELSQQISMAGTEASGTGNMKLALNGALTIGTLDGANVEIREHVGEENMFIFGLKSDETAALKQSHYRPRDTIRENHELTRVVDLIEDGHFSPEDPTRFHPIVDILTRNDNYLLTADYADYIATQQRVSDLYLQREAWAEKAILNIAGMGYFSSDRTIREYASKVWNVKTD